MLQTVSSKRGEHQGNDLAPSMIPRGEIKMGLLWKEATPEFVIHEGVEEIANPSPPKHACILGPVCFLLATMRQKR